MTPGAMCAHAEQGPVQPCPLWVGRGLCRCQREGAAVAPVGPALPAEAPAASDQWPRALLWQGNCWSVCVCQGLPCLSVQLHMLLVVFHSHARLYGLIPDDARTGAEFISLNESSFGHLCLQVQLIQACITCTSCQYVGSKVQYCGESQQGVGLL